MTLQSNLELPDPLVLLSGERVATPEDWFKRRRPELAELFQHYMYGYMPPAPDRIETTTRFVEPKYLGGKATLKEVEIRFGPPKTPDRVAGGTPATPPRPAMTCPPIRLLVASPNGLSRPAPAFVGLNFYGNHVIVKDPRVALPDTWVGKECPGAVANRATDTGRGGRPDAWPIEKIIARGYALATFYQGDIDPDVHDFSDGVHPHYYRPGQLSPGPHDWGTIAAWAWGLSRAVDYLVTDPAIDGRRIATIGHSRNGKAALVAAAFDERIAAAYPHQAGCGGTAPSRCTVGETVQQINDVFPHWFCGEFKRFNGRPDLLPFDQHCLVAMVAPRPVLFSNATLDTHANPAGQFEVLRAADPVYRLLGVDGLGAATLPPVAKLLDSRLGYFIREGKHSVEPIDWDAFLAFADRRLR